MTDEAERPAHSLLGASGAERWLQCPGSVALLNELELPETDEPEYRREGTAGHEAAAHALIHGLDAWELVGMTFFGLVIDDEMATAVQVYLDAVRPSIDLAVETMGHFYIETAVSSPVHANFYGTLDFAADVQGKEAFLDVTDLKMGMGIMVDVEDNPQEKYYAFGLIDGLERAGIVTFPDDHLVRLRIVQPRGYLEPVREWFTTVGAIKEWVNDTLVPAMARTEYDKTLDAGPWCRFCPAKLVCPMLTSLFKAASTYNPKEVIHISDESLGRSYQYLQAVDFYVKALKDETFRRLSTGSVVPGTYLTPKRANRVFKQNVTDDEGKTYPIGEIASGRLGAEAFSKPELKSVPEIEKLGKEGKAFAKEFGYKPETGLTVALDSEAKSKEKITVKPPSESFADAIAALPPEE